MSVQADVMEIEPADLEWELRAGLPLVILDVRPRAAFADWHIDSNCATLLNVPELEIATDPEATLALLPERLALRVICAAGNASQRVSSMLAEYGISAPSVRGGLVGWASLQRSAEIMDVPNCRVVQFRREARGCLSYLIASDGRGLVVDPCGDPAAYRAEAQRLGVEIVAIFDTHVHADHLSTSRELAAETGARLQLPSRAIGRGVSYPADPLNEGDEINLGDVRLRVVALPGHTTDMTGLLVNESALISGDSLFVDTIARPDLENGDARSAARTLHRTLSGSVAALPDTVRLLPGHYQGGRLEGALAPSLGEVRAAVPELGLDADRFVEWVVAGIPSKPRNYQAIIAYNLGIALDVEDPRTLELGTNCCAVSAHPDRR